MGRAWLTGLACLGLAACAGTAPAWQSPDAALKDSAAARRVCVDNTPPAGYGGPVSPHGQACREIGPAPAVPVPGTHDYRQGQPPRVVIP